MINIEYDTEKIALKKALELAASEVVDLREILGQSHKLSQGYEKPSSSQLIARKEARAAHFEKRGRKFAEEYVQMRLLLDKHDRERLELAVAPRGEACKEDSSKPNLQLVEDEAERTNVRDLQIYDAVVETVDKHGKKKLQSYSSFSDKKRKEYPEEPPF